MLLEHKVALVTGGARGIGAAIVRRYVEEGARVVFGDVEAAAGRALAEELTGHGHAVAFCRLDVTDVASVDAALDFCLDTYGRVDVLVCNAGILYNGPVLETPDEAWRRVIDVNLTGVFYSCRAVGRRMVEQGDGGRIIITSSIAGKRGDRLYGAYTASKFGVIGLLQVLAEELGPHDILVNGVCPGVVDTAMMDQLVREHAAIVGQTEDAYRRSLVTHIPVRHMADPVEVADVFVFLASPLARYVSGETINVDGAKCRI
jgi:NAD(P)-dependent dehydrogenase (short-subunit alcohol dehydrogenase family)